MKKIRLAVLPLMGVLSTLFMLLLSGQLNAQQATVENSAIGASAQSPDVRVVIDISGSMKQNDPQNLRRPALELLVQLFPPGSKAGVWTFGQWVNNLVASKDVDQAWRDNALSQALKINSVALHTNIPAALLKAVDDIDQLDPAYKVHLILLTDGMVDISKSPAENAKARDQIINQILPRLRAAGITVHTVALSQNADRELMERLAVETNGLAAVAETAEDLTNIFLQAFDAAVPVEQVPLEGNTFLVDSSIEEFTALIFRKPGSDAAVLISPEKQQFTLQNHSDDIKWFRQQNYDLITVTRPYEGEWTINAELEPNSRVTIVSNLSLQLAPLPKASFVGDKLELMAALQEQDKTITRPEFLNLIEVSMQVLRRDDGEQWRYSLSEVDPSRWTDTLSVISIC
ncbi:vWA domain-containing protein [Oceanicoccus sp. KOV_DT_Chl]|uniref:VWA domain-containing protein n=1 Tax=Oceanicoccus sp. KOV_DT_Chl TaxID=1904639 RepID=UPI0013596597|nr:vWA domain-containing protein [Oceanicoccus sp. KOV_DT_Chl]